MFLFELLFLIVFWGFIIFCGILLWHARVPENSLHNTPKTLGLTAESVQFPASDGKLLHGWKIPAVSTERPWVILCHGLSSEKMELLPIAKALHDGGFNCFLFDFRAHGESRGWFSTFGYREQFDIEGALIYLAQQPEIEDRPYGLFGVSMGASAALMVASRDERLGAIVADGPYLSLEHAFKRHLRAVHPMLPFWIFKPFFQWSYRLLFGTFPKSVAPLEAGESLGSTSVLLLGGSEDVHTPPTQIQELAEALPTASTWIVPGAGHLDGFNVQREQYTQKVVQFFKQELTIPTQL